MNYRTLLKYIFSFGLIISPLVFWPKSPVPYEIPRVWFVNRWIEVMGIVGVLGMLKKPKKENLNINIVVLVLLFLVIAFATSVIGADFPKSIVGNYYRGDGLIALSHFGLLFFITILYFEKSWLKPVSKAIALGSSITSIWALADTVRLHVFDNNQVLNWSGVIGATFGNPNLLVGYLLVTLPFIYFCICNTQNRKLKWVWIVALFAQVIAIVLTLSRTGIVGLFVFASGLLFISKSRKPRTFTQILEKRGVQALLGTWKFIYIATALFLATFFLTTSFKPKEKQSNIVVAEGRERIFRKAFLGFKKRPIVGWGWANFDYAFKAVDWPVEFKNDVYVDKAHSMLLEILITTGIVGFIVYVLIIASALIELFKYRNGVLRYFFLSFIILLVHSQTNIISVGEEIFFWIFLGISTKAKAMKSFPSGPVAK